MKRFTSILLSTLSVMVLSSCERVDITNGEVPEAYMELAKSLTGTYSGKLIHFPVYGRAGYSYYGDLNVGLLGRKLVVISTVDLAAPKCQSKVGNLLRIEVSDDGRFNRAVFAFDPANCNRHSGRGYEITFTLSEKDGQPEITSNLVLDGHFVKVGRHNQLVTEESHGRFKKTN